MTTTQNTPAAYLDEIVLYGGLPMTRAAVIADLQRIAPSRVYVDRYMQGLDLMEK